MAELKSPYFNFELCTHVLLEPRQLNNNLYINLKENLKKKVENKCVKYGYITNIYKINEYNEGILEPENFSGDVKYAVKYTARLCNPIENTSIICKVENINKILVKAVNGPIIMIIKKNDINTTIFKTNNKGEIKYKDNLLKINDYIIVNVIAKKLNYNDIRICTIGFLDRIPTQKEIDKYFEQNIEIDEDIINLNNSKDILSSVSKDNTTDSY